MSSIVRLRHAAQKYAMCYSGHDSVSYYFQRLTHLLVCFSFYFEERSSDVQTDIRDVVVGIGGCKITVCVCSVMRF